MAARPEPSHRTTGERLGYHGEVLTILLRCHSCQRTQTEVLDATASMREACADVTCANCARHGLMRPVKT